MITAVRPILLRRKTGGGGGGKGLGTISERSYDRFRVRGRREKGDLRSQPGLEDGGEGGGEPRKKGAEKKELKAHLRLSACGCVCGASEKERKKGDCASHFLSRSCSYRRRGDRSRPAVEGEGRGTIQHPASVLAPVS